MPSQNQRAFLNTLRRALGHREASRPAPAGLFPEHPTAKDRERLDRIAQRSEVERRELLRVLCLAAEPLQLRIKVVPDTAAASEEVAAIVRDSVPEWGGHRSVVAWRHVVVDALGLETALAPLSIPVHTPPAADASGDVSPEARAAFMDRVAAAFVGVTTADYCVAKTATLVLRTRPGQPRSVSLVPSIHVAVVPAEKMLADLTELYTLLRWDPGEWAEGPTTCLSLISGPSKTADIEATLVHGAHGPRALHLVVIGGR